MMFAHTRIDAPKNGASSREAVISVAIVPAPATNTRGYRSRFTLPAAYPWV